MVFYANGVLEINSTHLTFRSIPRPPLLAVLGNIEKNLRLDVAFRIARDEIVKIEPYEDPSPFMKYFTLPWTRLYTSHDGDLADFLVTVGGNSSLMGRLRRRNEQLLATLTKLQFGVLDTARDV
jgi:hypothetical protein